DGNGHTEPVPGEPGEIEGFHAEVDGVQHTPVRCVDQSRDSDADAAHVGEVESDVALQFADAVDHTGDDSVIAVPRRAPDAPDDLSVLGDGDSISLGAADVQADADRPPLRARLGECHYETPS